MKFYSTNGKSDSVNFETALMRGLVEDGGLYMPMFSDKRQAISEQLKAISEQAQTLPELAAKLLEQFVDIPKDVLGKICAEAFNFPAPLVKLSEDLYILELFHGPTLSFKDFGARFMARVMNYYISEQRTVKSDKRQATSEQLEAISNKRTVKSDKLNIIVATSGDTGSAVAQGFYGMENIRVFVLYPRGRVSKLQEQQMATLGKNIVALEVKGDFDDCQRLAKMALADKTLGISVSSANSINIGRLLPQMVYYFWAVRQFAQKSEVQPPTFVVPSGNFGNLTAGLFAKKLGLPCGKFIAAVNKNSIVPEYFRAGNFFERKTEMTYSSAMDVGLPSNWARIEELYKRTANSEQRIATSEQLEATGDKRMGGDLRGRIKEDLEAITISEAETKKTIADVYKKFGYIADPHTAVGIAATESVGRPKGSYIVLATAHPAKFPEIVEGAIGRKVELPEALRLAAEKEKRSMVIGKEYKGLVEALKNSCRG